MFKISILFFDFTRELQNWHFECKFFDKKKIFFDNYLTARYLGKAMLSALTFCHDGTVTRGVQKVLQVDMLD